MYSPAYQQQHYEPTGSGAFDELEDELVAAARYASQAKPCGRLLDVGCGVGRFLNTTRLLGLQVEGFEPVAETAERVALRSGHRIQSGSLGALAGASYDVVHLADVLEHLPQPDETLQQVARLLRPDGLVIARGPLEAQPHLFLAAVRAQRHMRQLLRPSLTDIPPWHVTQFTLRGWNALFSNMRFEVVEQVVSEIRWPAPVEASLSLRSGLKTISRAVSHSPSGRFLKLGNRVLTLARLSRQHRRNDASRTG